MGYRKLHITEKNMRIIIYESGFIRKSWKWKLVSENGRIVAFGRGFNSKQNAQENIKKIKKFFKGE